MLDSGRQSPPAVTAEAITGSRLSPSSTPSPRRLPEDAVGRLLDGRGQFLRFVRARLADEDLAEDVLQESLLRALRAAPSLRDDERLIPWFFRVLQHTVVDAYRRRDVERRHTIPLAAAGSAVEERTASPQAPSGNAYAALCACFGPLLPALRPEYADLIAALDLRGEPTEAVATRLGITSNNLKVRHHRARQALRRRLEETCRVCATHHCLDCTCSASTGPAAPAIRTEPEAGASLL